MYAGEFFQKYSVPTVPVWATAMCCRHLISSSELQRYNVFCVLLPTNPLRVGTYGQGSFQLVLEVERLSLSECQVVVAAYGTRRAKL